MKDVERVARAVCRAMDGTECSALCHMCLRDAQAAMRETLLIAAEAARQCNEGPFARYGDDFADYLKRLADAVILKD